MLGPLFAAAVGAGDRRAGWRWPRRRWPARRSSCSRCASSALIASDSLELQGHGAAAVDASRRPPRRCAACCSRVGAIALPLLATGRHAGSAAHGRALLVRARRRDPRPLPVLRQRRAQAHGRAVHRSRQARPHDAQAAARTRHPRRSLRLRASIRSSGYVSAQKVPDRWVATTCGYCSVGCGMFIGVKDGRAVAVRGNPDHPVNRGMLCPKGSREHHTIARRQPRAVSAAATRRQASSASAGTRRSTTMAAKFRDVQAQLRRRTRSASSAPASSSPRSSTRSASWCSSASARRNYDGNTTLCMATAVAGYKRSFGSDGPPGAYEDLETRRRHPADRRQHRRQPSDSLPAPARPTRTRR